MKSTDIYKVYGEDYTNMTRFILDKAGLCEMIPQGAKIGIKPNLVSPTPAEYGATTHPQVVEGIITYLQENGLHNIVIIEGSWVGDKTEEAYELCGYRELCERYGVEFIDTQKDSYELIDCDGMEINICKSALSIDFLINVPVMKGHGQTKLTCALKNLKGLIPNSEKRLFHQRGLHKPIAHLAKKLNQQFIVLDHICGDLELEDGGNPIVKNCIMAATDPVLLDSYCASLLGYEVADIPYIGMSHDLEVGECDISKGQITVFDMNEPKHVGNSFCAVMEDEMDRRLSPSELLTEISLAVEEVYSCSSCYGALAPALCRLRQEGLLDKLKKALGSRIAIGQGYRGQRGSFGVGNCCKDFDVYVKGCPPDEEDIYQALVNIVKE